MKQFTLKIMTLSLLASAGVCAGQTRAAEADKNHQIISLAGSQASMKGPANILPVLPQLTQICDIT
jgi:hypothetical protein